MTTMFDNELTKKTIEARLAPVLSVFEEKVIPAEVKLLKNNRYTEKYAWMYSYEKHLKYKIEAILKIRFLRSQESILFGSGGAFSEGLSNAFTHGHRRQPCLPITIWTTVSSKGVGFAIQDTGEGFDTEHIFSLFKSGTPFYHIAGNGLKSLDTKGNIRANYGENGTVLYLCYHFE